MIARDLVGDLHVEVEVDEVDIQMDIEFGFGARGELYGVIALDSGALGPDGVKGEVTFVDTRPYIVA